MDDQEQTTEDTNLDAFSSEFFGTSTETPQDTQQVEANDKEGVVSEDAEQEVEGSEPDTQTEVVEDETEEQEQEVAAEPKPKKTVQERIDELVKQREDAKREAAAELEAVRKEFEEKLAALQAPKQEAQKVPGEPTPDDTNEDGTPKYDLGEFDPQYIRDLTRYTLEQERTKAAEQSAEEARVNQERQAQAELAQQWNEKVEVAKTEYPDFMEKGQELLNGFGGLEQSYATYLSNLLMSMDKGPQVLYYLSSNPAEAVAIVNSGAQKATLALGRIEAKFLEADAHKTLAKPKASKAPAPPPSQARSRGTNGAVISVAPDTDDLEAFAGEFFAKTK